jgi:hypothetical protein
MLFLSLLFGQILYHWCRSGLPSCRCFAAERMMGPHSLQILCHSYRLRCFATMLLDVYLISSWWILCHCGFITYVGIKRRCFSFYRSSRLGLRWRVLPFSPLFFLVGLLFCEFNGNPWTTVGSLVPKLLHLLNKIVSIRHGLRKKLLYTMKLKKTLFKTLSYWWLSIHPLTYNTRPERTVLESDIGWNRQ